MSDLAQSWLRRDARVNSSTTQVTTNWVQVFAASSSRYLMILPSNPTAIIVWWLSEIPPTAGVPNIPPNAPPLILTEDEFGGAITYPLWIAASAPVANYSVVTAHYEPRSQAIYERMMHEFFSQYATP